MTGEFTGHFFVFLVLNTIIFVLHNQVQGSLLHGFQYVEKRRLEKGGKEFLEFWIFIRDA